MEPLLKAEIPKGLHTQKVNKKYSRISTKRQPGNSSILTLALAEGENLLTQATSSTTLRSKIALPVRSQKPQVVLPGTVKANRNSLQRNLNSNEDSRILTNKC